MASEVPINNEESASSTHLIGDADGANDSYSEEIKEFIVRVSDSF